MKRHQIYLSKNCTPKFEQIYIYDYLTEVDHNVMLLDYSEDKALQDKDLYFNSFFLNERGANCLQIECLAT